MIDYNELQEGDLLEASNGRIYSFVKTQYEHDPAYPVVATSVSSPSHTLSFHEGYFKRIIPKQPYDKNTERLLKAIGRCPVCPYLMLANCPGVVSDEDEDIILCGGGLTRYTYAEWKLIS